MRGGTVSNVTDVIIIGGGIGGLVLALSLHQIGVPCRVYEGVPKIKALGLGINLLPHASRELHELGLLPALDAVAIRTRETMFYTRHGQFIYREDAGLNAGYDWPQYSIHRGDLQMVLLNAVLERLGPDGVITDARCIDVEQDGSSVIAHFQNNAGEDLPNVRGKIAIGCDGIRSAIRKQLYPDEGPLRYFGINMWRGITRCKPFLSGATMVRVGNLATGKMAIYPIRDNIDEQGNQLVNWTCEMEVPQPQERDWNRRGALEDFFPAFSNWSFDWLDATSLILNADTILEYPMVDQDPLKTWTQDRLSLLGDAAHPMVPRGSNGAGQAILDARVLTGQIQRYGVTPQALTEYDHVRVNATTRVVIANRNYPPDVILREAYERSGDKPFDNIEDLISQKELADISLSYKQIAGFDPDALKARKSFIAP